jgi:hypothetical protein
MLKITGTVTRISIPERFFFDVGKFAGRINVQQALIQIRASL